MKLPPGWRAAVGNQRPYLLALPAAEFEPLRMDAAAIDRLISTGVPFHMAGDRKQDERPKPAEAARRLAAGETLYLVQPHEYLPRLRSFLYRLSAASGFLGRPARTFLFRVDAPGREAMGMHDDGATDLAWVQLDGERYVTLGTPDASGRKQALSQADGKRTGWFRGGQKAGTLLFLPPWAPHEVLCRKPSIALSIYWEPVSPEESAVEFAGALLDAHAQRNFPSSGNIRTVLRKLQGMQAALGEWLSLKESEDGGRDHPPAAGREWDDPALRIQPWRALVAWEAGRVAKVAAGGEAVLTFPAKALTVLARLANYRAATRAELAAVSKLRPRELDNLLAALFGEGLITQGELPFTGKFLPEELTGWEYAVEQ